MSRIAVPRLAEFLGDIPEFRHARGKRHPLLAILLLSCVAMWSGARSERAIAEWATTYGADWRARLGFRHGHGPSQATIHRIFTGIDRGRLEAQLGRWAAQVLTRLPASDMAPPSLEGIALDGKTWRGSTKRGAGDAHLLSALSQRGGWSSGRWRWTTRPTRFRSRRRSWPNWS